MIYCEVIIHHNYIHYNTLIETLLTYITSFYNFLIDLIFYLFKLIILVLLKKCNI